MTARRVVQTAYGGPEVLGLVPFEPSEPGDGELLVRIVTTSVNPIDVKSRVGGGAAAALGDFPIALGWDVAGVVERAGRGAEGLLGQRVFGMPCFPQQAATHATHAVLPADQLLRIPDGMDDLTAGALPLAGLTALSAVRDLARVSPGDRVLVRGAGGGVGHLAVQIARLLGAEVAAVVSADKADFVRSLGVDEVLVRGEGGAASRSMASVGAVIDLVGGGHLAESVDVTLSGGVVVCVPGGADAGLDELAARRGVRAARASVRPDAEGLAAMARWHAEGALTVHVSAIHDLEDIVAAHRRLEAGSVRGKIAIRATY